MSAQFNEVCFRASARDRAGRPVAGLRLRLSARLSGLARDFAGRTLPFDALERRDAITDGRGEIWIEYRPPLAPERGGWFSGTVEVGAEAADPLKEPLTLKSERGEKARLTLFEAPDGFVEGFPLWAGAGGRTERVVVLLEGFDFTNAFTAVRSLNLVSGAADALRSAGTAVLVVSFKSAYESPNILAREAEAAIRAASRAAGGRKVAVAGLSAGGIVARWALSAAESQGAPLPVHTLLLLDSPNRGANVPPKLQALAAAYAGPVYRSALQSDAAKALLAEYALDADWRYAGQRPLGYRLPERVRTTSAYRDRFFAQLRTLGRNGYPARCRVVGVANSSRTARNDVRRLLRVWLPLNHFWTLAAEDADRRPGSLLSKAALHYAFRLPLGVAGATLPELPTFLPAASALDAEPGETPPFDAWYARPPDSSPVPHDEISPDVARFVVRELLRDSG